MAKAVFVVNGVELSEQAVQVAYNGFADMMSKFFKGQVPVESKNRITSEPKYTCDDLMSILPTENAKYLGGKYNQLFIDWIADHAMFDLDLCCLFGGSYIGINCNRSALMTFRPQHGHQVKSMRQIAGFGSPLKSMFQEEKPQVTNAETGHPKNMTSGKDKDKKEQQSHQSKPQQQKPQQQKPEPKPEQKEAQKVINEPAASAAAAFPEPNAPIPFSINNGSIGMLDNILKNGDNQAAGAPQSIDLIPEMNMGNVASNEMNNIPPEVLKKLEEREGLTGHINAVLDQFKKSAEAAGSDNPALALMEQDPNLTNTVNAMQQMYAEAVPSAVGVAPQVMAQQPVSPTPNPMELNYSLDGNLGKFSKIMADKGIDPNIILNRINQLFSMPDFKVYMYQLSNLPVAMFRFMYIEDANKFGLVTNVSDSHHLKITFADRVNVELRPNKPRNNGGGHPVKMGAK